MEAAAIRAVKNDIAKSVLVYLGRNGRVMIYENVLLQILRSCNGEIECLRRYGIFFDLVDLLSEYDTFYYYRLQGVFYVALARNFHIINPRLASFMVNISDQQREQLIRYSLPLGTAGPTVPPRNLDFAKKYGEFEFAKSALAVLEILNAITRDGVRYQYDVTYESVLARCQHLSQLATEALGFCSSENLRNQVNCFLAVFGRAFRREASVVSIDGDIVFGLKHAVESDLLWSYAGVCIAEGLTDIVELLSELNRFIRRARIMHLPRVDLEEVTEYLESRPDMCMLTGDGKVWLMEPLSRVPEIYQDDVAVFFTNYLRDTTISYAECYPILMRGSPMLKEVLQQETSITIASYLFKEYDTFFFLNGQVGSGLEGLLTQRLYQLRPLDVPAGFESNWVATQDAPDSTEAKVIKGIVIELGIRNAVIAFRANLSMFYTGRWRSKMAMAHAYCDCAFTKINDEYTTDLTDILDCGDYVSASVTGMTKRTMVVPYHYLVRSIFKETKKEGDDSGPPDPPSDKKPTDRRPLSPDSKGGDGNSSRKRGSYSKTYLPRSSTSTPKTRQRSGAETVDVGSYLENNFPDSNTDASGDNSSLPTTASSKIDKIWEEMRRNYTNRNLPSSSLGEAKSDSSLSVNAGSEDKSFSSSIGSPCKENSVLAANDHTYSASVGSAADKNPSSDKNSSPMNTGIVGSSLAMNISSAVKSLPSASTDLHKDEKKPKVRVESLGSRFLSLCENLPPLKIDSSVDYGTQSILVKLKDSSVTNTSSGAEEGYLPARSESSHCDTTSAVTLLCIEPDVAAMGIESNDEVGTSSKHCRGNLITPTKRQKQSVDDGGYPKRQKVDSSDSVPPTPTECRDEEDVHSGGEGSEEASSEISFQGETLEIVWPVVDGDADGPAESILGIPTPDEPEDPPAS